MVFDTPEAIAKFQLRALLGAVQLEAKGMTRRGRSATVLAKEQLGLPKSTPREVVIAKLREKFEA